MILCKLIGYDAIADAYTDPKTGQIDNLPNPPFAIADAAPENYDSFDTIENWARYATNTIGSVYGLREYRSIRWEIYTRIETICGADYSNWDLLSAEQKSIALEWSNIRIINSRGLSFYYTECGSQEKGNFFIDTYLTNAKKASELRYYVAFTKFGFTYMGKVQGLKAEDIARRLGLYEPYVIRGVVFRGDDGIDGLGDWIMGLNGYDTTGLKPRIISGEFTLIGGIDADTFCNSLIAILDDGLF